MDTTKLFQEPIPELSGLPAHPKAFWYVSAGRDFHGPVFLTDDRIQQVQRHEGRLFEKPDLFVFSCVGQEVNELRELLARQNGGVLFKDDRTTIVGENHQRLTVLPPFNADQELNPEHINHDHADGFLGDAFYFEARITGHGYQNAPYEETQKLLYFNYENIDFFRKIILHNLFDVRYLRATHEGAAWGGNRRSIITHIHDQEDLYIGNGFMPGYIILSEGVSSGQTLQDAFDSKRIIDLDRYTGYSLDRSVIHKVGYPPQR